MEFNPPAPPSVPNDEPYATNEVSMSDYCKFEQVLQLMPYVDNIKCDCNLGIELGSAPSDKAHYKFVLCMDRTSWRPLIVKKDLHPELLRWHLLVEEFNFEVHHEG